jgi:hypothetical protein
VAATVLVTEPPGPPAGIVPDGFAGIVPEGGFPEGVELQAARIATRHTERIIDNNFLFIISPEI